MPTDFVNVSKALKFLEPLIFLWIIVVTFCLFWIAFRENYKIKFFVLKFKFPQKKFRKSMFVFNILATSVFWNKTTTKTFNADP